MKHLDVLNRFNDALARHAAEVEVSAAMQHFDIAHVSENLVLGLLREICGLKHLRNLNTDERTNFPGLDLLDEAARVGVQVTASSSLDKVKTTLETCKRHGLDTKIDRLIVYVLTRRQDSYSQNSVDRIGVQFRFDASRDVMDFRDLARLAGTVDPVRLTTAAGVLEAYQRGVPIGLSEIDFDPPATPMEKVSLNLLELYIPQTLYVADIVELKGKSASQRQGQREKLRRTAGDLGFRLPSDFMVSAGRLFTFYDLDQPNHPFEKLIDVGTVTPLTSNEFCRIDSDHERLFKGLLRFSVQQKLFKHGVHWMHDDNLFAFMPQENEFEREESWIGQKQSTRRVFEKKLNKTDETKVFVCRHFAFAVDFIRSDAGWYVALAPDWYFSNGTDFRRSFFADKSLSWIKRRENNRAVLDHFRFLSAWLKALDEDDLFTQAATQSTTVAFGEPVTFPNHPPLDDDAWLPVRLLGIEPDANDVARLFDSQ